MKKALISSLFLVVCLSAVVVFAQQATAPAAPAAPAKAASLDITRMDIAGSVENRQPAGIATTFPATQEKVYCYLELKNVASDTTITYVWTLGLNEMGRVPQQVKKSARWRTWGNKSIGGMKGDWKVDVLDQAGTVLKSAAFKVE